MSGGMNYVGSPQPYQLPGYGGHCPDMPRVGLGRSFGSATHRAMCDPLVRHAPALALSCLPFPTQYPHQGFGDNYSTGVKADLDRKQLRHEVMLLKGTRRPRNMQDRTMIHSARLPLTPVTVLCQGYKRPVC